MCCKKLARMLGGGHANFLKGTKTNWQARFALMLLIAGSTAAPLHPSAQITEPPNWTAAQGQALTFIAGSLDEALRPCPLPQSSQPLCRLLLPPLPRLPADVLARGAGATLEGGGAT